MIGSDRGSRAAGYSFGRWVRMGPVAVALSLPLVGCQSFLDNLLEAGSSSAFKWISTAPWPTIPS
jgi:hypothetical protein